MPRQLDGNRARSLMLLDAGRALRIRVLGQGSIVEQAAKSDETTVERRQRRWIFVARFSTQVFIFFFPKCSVFQLLFHSGQSILLINYPKD